MLSSTLDIDNTVSVAKAAVPVWSVVMAKAYMEIMHKFHAHVKEHAHELTVCV